MILIPMPNRIAAVETLGGHTLRMRFRDGAVFELDLLPLIQRENGSAITDPLSNPTEFQKVHVDYGTLVFSTGYDICPDVLRLWCEQGRVLSREETDRYFLKLLAVPQTA